MSAVIDLAGQRFERWTVLSRGKSDRWGQASWLCECDCGQRREVRGYDLRAGRSVSCSCLSVELLKGRVVTHGMTNDPVYKSWQDAKARCTNPNNSHWEYYGGRGVEMVKEWMDSFEKFYAHIGPKPSERHTLDRVDPDGNYAPGNVRWATAREQRLNQRRMKRE